MLTPWRTDDDVEDEIHASTSVTLEDLIEKLHQLDLKRSILDFRRKLLRYQISIKGNERTNTNKLLPAAKPMKQLFNSPLCIGDRVQILTPSTASYHDKYGIIIMFHPKFISVRTDNGKIIKRLPRNLLRIT